MLSVFALIQPVFAIPEPTVSADPVTNITTTSATLNGTISSAGGSAVTSRGFNYGLTNSYGDMTNETFAESYESVAQWGSTASNDGTLHAPTSQAFDSAGNIYVADSNNHRIQKFNSSGVYQSQFGGYGTGNGQFSTPIGIAIDSGDNLYVADTYNNRIQKFNSSGVYQSQFGGYGTGNGQFSLPNGIVIDSGDNVYVADSNNHRIQKFNSSGVYQSKFGTNGSGDGQFSRPIGIAIDSADNLYVADTDNHRIQKFNSSGVYQSKFGTNGSGDGQFNTPFGIAIDSADNLYVADTYNNRIQKFNSSGVYQSKFGTSCTGNSQFTYIGDMVVDNSGNILVLDTDSHCVQKFNSSGVYQSKFGTYGPGQNQLSYPYGVTIDSSGNVYIADTTNSRIQKFNSSGVYQSQFGTNGSGNGEFSNPRDIVVDSVGDLYVVDANNSRIQKFNSSGVYQSQFGTNGSGDGQFNNPTGIAIDSADNLYVADTDNHRIQKFNSSGVYQSQFGTNGSGDGQFNNPTGIAIDSADNLYVADTYNNRIQKFNSSGVYQSQFGNVGAAESQLLRPRGLAVDSSGNVYVSDTDNHRIQKFSMNLHEGAFSADISGLTCGTTYHFQAYATNTNGSSQTGDATFTTSSCSPGPPTNIQTSINSSSAIDISWDAPAHTGDSAILKYYIHYRKSGEVDWTILDTNSDDTSALLSGLRPSTQYDIKVYAENTNNNTGSGSEIIVASTGTPGFYLVSNCQQLQDINNDLVGNYELARNIDCSDTVNWHGGTGFQPIGNFFAGQVFSGVFAGNNYAINDLYIKQESQESAIAALFGSTNGALIQDIRIVRPTFLVSATQVGVVGGLVGFDINTTSTNTSVNNVHIQDASLQGYGEQLTYAAGLVAVSSNTGTTSDSRNEFEGTINISGSNGGALATGGLYGLLEGGARNVDNSYANANITIENIFPGEAVFATAGGLLGGNGLMLNSPTQTNISHSYAAGSITYNSAQQTNSVALGGIVGAVTKVLSVENSFARNSLTNLQPGIINGMGGIIAGVYGPEARTYSNNYFDADQAGTTNCIDPFSGVISGCTPIQGNPTYFYNNSNNAPLNTWDFDNIWQTTSTLPVFGKKVLTSISSIPESRLNSNKTSRAEATPAITELVQKLKTPPVAQFGGQKTTTAPQEGGIIGAIKRFFKNLPEVVLVSFPYALFSLLLLAACAMLVQVIINSRRLQATKLLIAKQRAVAEERDTFWHIAANYLRAPITLMVGGVELLSTDKDIRPQAVANLEAFTKNLQKKVFAIMSRIEQSRTLQDIHWPELDSSSRVLSQLKFWLPIGLVAFFAVLMNLVAKNYRKISISSTNLAIQLLIFILVSVLFYWVLSALGLVNRKRKQAETILEQQSASLDAARTEFIEQSAATLDSDLSALESQLDHLPSSITSTSIVREGARRLRSLIDSFELLVAAENNKLDTLSPSSPHTQLNTIFDSVIASLNPLIAQKHIRVVKPDFGRMTVPGNSLLLNQVINSVLSNAIAFSPPGSTVEVKLKSDKDDILLSVTNQGKTIGKDQLSHIFSPFMKADGYNALQLDHGGLGVNLYIDSLIMRHLSGAIDVSSDTNKGTTMTMRWPTVRPGMAG